MTNFKVLTALLVMVLIPSLVLGEGEGPRSEDFKGRDVIRIGNITVDKVSKEIRIGSKLAVKKGILEYLLVGNHGKTYESVFKVRETKPSDLNFALLLIGCEPLDLSLLLKLRDEKDGPDRLSRFHKGSLLEIEIFREGERVDLKRIIRDREGARRPLLWVYTGGYFLRNDRFAGDNELNYIAIWPDRSAPINLFTRHKNPYRGPFGFEINGRNRSLAVDQDFEIVIRRHDQ